MHAVMITSHTLDLIATNNGGLKPDVEAWGGYFILPTDPNDPAEIVPIDVFFRNYVFIGTEATDRFRPIKAILQFELRDHPYDEGKAAYAIDRNQLAQMVAAHTSGYEKATAEQEDFEIADEMLAFLEERLKPTCPRCGGDHSWCQMVQDGEFG